MEPKVDEILKRIQNKKSILLENKLLYSKKTDELSVENQFYSKVSKVIKKQNSNIKKSTKIYINNCVKRALYEAELEYSQDILSNLSNNKQHVRSTTKLLLLPTYKIVIFLKHFSVGR